MIDFSNAPGNLFNRLGKIGKVLSQARTCQLAQYTNLVDVSAGLVAQFNAEADLQALIGQTYIGTLDNVGSVGSLMQQLAQQTVNRVVFRDNPQQNQTLTQVTVAGSLAEIIRQMIAEGATIQRQTVTATASGVTGSGDGGVIVSVYRPRDGLMLENAYAETILVKCTQDGYSGGATAGNESFSVTGTGSQSNPFAFNWPLGSNAQLGLSAVSGGASNSAGNLLTNSSFDTWATGVPANWSVTVGASTVSQQTTIVYGNASSLAITGDGSTLTSLQQQFGNSTGTAAALSPLSQYGVNFYLRRDGSAPAAGALAIELVDGNGAVISDAAGTVNRTTVDLTTLSTNWTAYKAAFRTPAVMPSAQYLQLRLSSALTSGRTVYLDRGSLAVMTQTYPSGPYLSVYSGASPFKLNDFVTVAVTNSRGAGGSLNTFQTLLARLFPSEVVTAGLVFPSSATPTISDSLIS